MSIMHTLQFLLLQYIDTRYMYKHEIPKERFQLSLYFFTIVDHFDVRMKITKDESSKTRADGSGFIELPVNKNMI